jgi:hypothetical protein
LVDAAMYEDTTCAGGENPTYARRAIRGQNLDRTGLAARHIKVLNALAEPQDAQSLASTLGWEAGEVQQVMSAFLMAELVEQRTRPADHQFIVFEPNAEAAQCLRASLEGSDHRYDGKVVRDQLALQLALKHSLPHTFVFAADDTVSCKLVAQLFASKSPQITRIKRIAILDEVTDAEQFAWNEKLGFVPDGFITRPCTAEHLFRAIDRLDADSVQLPRAEQNVIPASIMSIASDACTEHTLGGKS